MTSKTGCLAQCGYCRACEFGYEITQEEIDACLATIERAREAADEIAAEIVGHTQVDAMFSLTEAGWSVNAITRGDSFHPLGCFWHAFRTADNYSNNYWECDCLNGEHTDECREAELEALAEWYEEKLIEVLDGFEQRVRELLEAEE